MATSRSDRVRGVFAQRRRLGGERQAAGRRPFDRVLVANRGEIAVRIIRACRELGIEAVAVYSDADADALHVRLADDAVRIGPAPAAESYLRIDAILDAARRDRRRGDPSGLRVPGRAGGLRPGRRPTPGSIFVGPAAATIEALGDKLGARRLARGGRGRDRVRGRSSRRRSIGPTRCRRSSRRRERIGFPLLVKAAAGGGGRGMRRVERAADLPAALAAAAAEALAAFGDGTVYLEREIRPARHVEVQLLGDAAGAGRGDRGAGLLDPAPPPEARRGGAGARADRRGAPPSCTTPAVRIGTAAGLANAATAEFLRRAGRGGLLPRGQHPAPGRARHHRAGHRARHRPRAVPAGRGRAALRSRPDRGGRAPPSRPATPSRSA